MGNSDGVQKISIETDGEQVVSIAACHVGTERGTDLFRFFIFSILHDVVYMA